MNDVDFTQNNLIIALEELWTNSIAVMYSSKRRSDPQYTTGYYVVGNTENICFVKIVVVITDRKDLADYDPYNSF